MVGMYVSTDFWLKTTLRHKSAQKHTITETENMQNTKLFFLSVQNTENSHVKAQKPPPAPPKLHSSEENGEEARKSRKNLS